MRRFFRFGFFPYFGFWFTSRPRSYLGRREYLSMLEDYKRELEDCKKEIEEELRDVEDEIRRLKEEGTYD